MAALGSMEGPYVSGATVTPNDSTALAGGATKALWIGGAGNITITWLGGTQANQTFTSVPAGTLLRVRATKVLATGTTATNIVALY